MGLKIPVCDEEWANADIGHRMADRACVYVGLAVVIKILSIEEISGMLLALLPLDVVVFNQKLFARALTRSNYRLDVSSDRLSTGCETLAFGAEESCLRWCPAAIAS